MLGLLVALFVGLELKHFVADYLLQPGWMLAGKANLRRAGGYAHAGIHAALTGLVLLLCATAPGLSLIVVAAEFVVHYGLDYSKIRYSRGVHVDADPGRFWALHGLDQLAHQLTYGAIIAVAMAAHGLTF